MDFPVFHLDFLNNRFLVGIIAVIHVLINHPLAVGGFPAIVLLEWRGSKIADAKAREGWDSLAYRLLFVFFVITTTIGAMTGVGIWFSTSLVNPYAIGSLLRVFFWAWFIEWIVFVTEVVLIMAYFLTWKRWLGEKVKHVRLGLALSITSWITMAIIVAILGFMMDPGNWQTQRSLLHGFLNPLYLPQLAFRTPFAMVMGGVVVVMLINVLARGDHALRVGATRILARWTLAWMPALAIGSYWYFRSIPKSMIGNLAVANATQEFASWHQWLLAIIVVSSSITALVMSYASIKRTRIHWAAVLAPTLMMAWMLAHFERVREFIRKPYAIGGYLYANGFRVEDYPLYKRDGILKHATYASNHDVSDANKVHAGKEVFVLACSRCHTMNGINSIRKNIAVMYGEGPWSETQLRGYIASMHNTRSYMPPFPGNEIELDALAAYLVHAGAIGDTLPGSQSIGARLTR